MKLVLSMLAGAAINYFLIPDYIRDWLFISGFILLGACILFGICEAAFRKT